jgi:hypothetical protein
MDATAVRSQRTPRITALSMLLGALSWVALFWTTPAAFACSLFAGALAIWIGWIGYRHAAKQSKELSTVDVGSGAPSTGSFRPIFRSALGGASGLIAVLLASMLWITVWPEIAERRVREQRAAALLNTIRTQIGGSIPADLPKFSKPGGLYPDSVAISLAGEGPDSVICYTLDGSEPTTGSTIYTAPVVISRTATIKAKAFRPGRQPSEIASDTYMVADRDMTNFTSNLPLVVINTYGRQVSRQPSTKVFARFISPSKGRSHFSAPADYSGPAEMHLRGSSTLRFPKRSFTITTGKEKASIFGFPKDSDWVLYAPYQDKTLMRDALAYELSRDMGHYSVRTKFVEVFLNTSGNRITRSDYIGVYVFEEKIKRGKDRVNIESLTPSDNTEPKISGGYIFKRDHADRNENGFYTRNGGPYYYVYPREREITPAQRRWLRSYMERFEAALYGPDFMDPANGYRAFLDVDSFIDQHWLIEMSKNVDGFRYSAYLHKDREGKLVMGPAWDWNLSFGNADFYGGWSTYEWYNLHLRSSEISWYRKLRTDPDFMQRCTDRWAQLRTNQFNTDRILKRIDEMAAQLQEAQVRNFNRWGIMGQRVHANWNVGRNYRDEVNWMKKWITERIAWIDRQMAAGPKVLIKESADAGARTLTIETRTGLAYYTLDGSDPRDPGGAISAKALPYTAPVTLKAEAQVFARIFHSNTWSSPSTAQADAPAVRSASLSPAKPELQSE